MGSRIVMLFACLLALGSVDGCGGQNTASPATVSHITASSRPHAKPGPFTTITFQAGKDGTVRYVAPDVPPTEVVSAPTTVPTATGKSEIEKQRTAAAAAADEFLLVIAAATGNRTFLYTITTGRTVTSGMNGAGLNTPGEHELVVSAPSGADSIVVIADSESTQTTVSAGTVDKPDVLDLDSGKTDGSKATAAQADIKSNGILGVGLGSANSARYAEWRSSLDPTLVTCASLPPQSYKSGTLLGTMDSLSGAWAETKGMTPNDATWCVRTNQGRYGAVALLHGGAPWQLKYVTWRKPSDEVAVASNPASPR